MAAIKEIFIECEIALAALEREFPRMYSFSEKVVAGTVGTVVTGPSLQALSDWLADNGHNHKIKE